MKKRILNYVVLLAIFVVILMGRATVVKSQDQGQGWFRIGINMGQAIVKIAVPDFPTRSNDPRVATLTKDFNQVLWNDLNNSGIVDGLPLIDGYDYPLL